MVAFPGIPSTADGSEAVIWVESHISQGACAYPITPSTNMGGGYQMAVANGRRNLWGEALAFLEPESEHSSASACEGFALAGGRVANFTSGQGLILMKEVLYVIAGKRLPVVFHIGARALTSQALNIHAGHDDVMGVADCGWGMLFARNAQEAADLALIARRAAEEAETPFFDVQDGFLTTHTIESLKLPEPELMQEFIGDPASEHRLRNLMDPAHPIMSGVVQNQDSYMKGKIAQRYFYDRLPAIVQQVMARFSGLTGRRYAMIDPYRLEGAEHAIVGMGSLLETAAATVDYLRQREQLKVGSLHVTCYRPFPGPEIVEALKHLKSVAVIERLDDPAAQSNPLTVAIKAAFADALAGAPGYPALKRAPVVYSGAAGLGSRDIRPADFVAVVDHMRRQKERRFFVLGIKHELALVAERDPDVRPPGAFSMRGYSIGGYGSVTTNKIIAT
ncbi:MAG: pyruvate ferredoxin oxidoreductase, partial [Deltaproteobacteria bacterium]|nr:pyruvate ferredoxin oxidoreductase [Deltaproteobacteria bacterium]